MWLFLCFTLKNNKFHKIYFILWIFTVYILYITEDCSTTQLCEYFITIRNMEARKAHLCHWNETQVVISSHVSNSCPSVSPSVSPTISYQWVLILNHQLNYSVIIIMIFKQLTIRIHVHNNTTCLGQIT